MKIAVLSGKGGSGITTVATNLAHVLDFHYVDCNVGKSNGYMFLNPSIEETISINVMVPSINMELCNLCGQCVVRCQRNALVKTNASIVFHEMRCIGCGLCSLICPLNAIKRISRSIGTVFKGRYNGQLFLSGQLNVGESMAFRIIEDLKSRIPEDDTALIACPTGMSNSVVRALKGVDYAILVTEPTKFGLQGLKSIVSLVRNMKVPHSIVINKSKSNNQLLQKYCEYEKIAIIGEIPFSVDAAKLYSKGILLIKDPAYYRMFEEIGMNLYMLKRWIA